MEITVVQALQSGAVGMGAAVVVTFLLKTWITNRVAFSIKHEYDAKLEEIKGLIETQVSQDYERWVLKRNACLQALRLANATLSNYKLTDLKSGKAIDGIMPQYMTIDDARACIDELACSCESPEVLDNLKRILFSSGTAADIVDLRNAVRRELGFELEEIDHDREKAFIGKLACVKSDL